MNRFARLSDEAGLTEEQRERLLAEAQRGEVSDELRSEIEAALLAQQKQGRAAKLTTDEVVDSATAMPPTLSGPEQIWTTPARQSEAEDTGKSSGVATVTAAGGTTTASKQPGKNLGKELKDSAQSNQGTAGQNDTSKSQPQASAGGQAQQAKEQKQPQKRGAAPAAQPAADAQHTTLAPTGKAGSQAGSSSAAASVAVEGTIAASKQTGLNLGKKLKDSARSNQDAAGQNDASKPQAQARDGGQVQQAKGQK
ncbi:MAG: hypothetical protein GY797_05315, partial [Deltaproteobacteria bacterium]|nr:hypothetical protein [Deltaproteobacteria bacterium]